MNTTKDRESIARIGCQYCVSILDKATIPCCSLSKVIKQELASSLSGYIMNNLDTLPIEYTSHIDNYDGNETHKVELILISRSEFERIKHMINR